LTFPIFYKKQEILIKKLKVFSDKVDFESKNKVQFFQYLKIFFGLLFYLEFIENYKLHRFAFLGVDASDIVMRIVGLECMRKAKKKFTRNSE